MSFLSICLSLLIIAILLKFFLFPEIFFPIFQPEGFQQQQQQQKNDDDD